MSVHFTIRGYNPLYADDQKAHKQLFDALGLANINGAGASELHNIDRFRSDADEPPNFSALQAAVNDAFPGFIVAQSGPESFVIGEPEWLLPPPK